MKIVQLFARDKRLRSGWRVALYLICYVTGLLIVQTPLVGLYGAYLVMQDVTTLASVIGALHPSRLPIWFGTALKGTELLMALVLTYLFGWLLDRRAFVTFGFRSTQGREGDLLLGTALGLAFYPITQRVEKVLSRPRATTQIDKEPSSSQN